MRLASLILAFALTSFVSVAAFAGSFSDDQKKEMEDIIHTYLTAHPEVLQEMVQKLDAQQKQAETDDRTKAIATSGKELFRSGVDGVGGNPDGDVTMVEFMDFNCGVCKHTFADIQAVVKADPKVRLVLKEWPVVGGPPSVYAAKAVIAVQKQGKYWPLHQALYEHVGTVTPDVVDKLAKENGVNVDKMKADMKDASIDEALAETNKLATDLHLTGTPGFVIGDRVIPGAESSDYLLSMIAETRASGTAN